MTEHELIPPQWPEYDTPLDPFFAWTPINRDAPIAYARLRKRTWGVQWEVIRCPYCGGKHWHGAGDKGDDPKSFLGGRVAHCLPHGDVDEYRLVEWNGHVLPTRAEIRRSRVVAEPVIALASARQPIPRELRAEVWAKSNGHCWYCGDLTNPFENFHVDHVTPVIDGGGNDLDNLVPCCQPCNSRKRDRPVVVLRAYVPGGVFWFEREGKS